MDEIAPKDLWPANKIKWLLSDKFIKSYWHIVSYWVLLILCEYINEYCIIKSAKLYFPQLYKWNAVYQETGLCR